jgi:choline monooxygenase
LLSAQDYYVDPNIRHAESLPASAFTDEEFLELEMKTILASTWLLVPPGDLPGEFPKSQGASSPFSLLDKPLFLQRGLRGQLHCFPNVCTHAWHPLVESASVGGAIICPQHGRQFDSEGRFVSQTGFDELQDFPRESDHLKHLPVEEWRQFVFVCPGRPIAPFHDFVKEVEESIAGVLFDRLSGHPLQVEVREVEGNWKQHAWNYMDNFHIRFVHKGPGGLADAIELSSYATELYEFSSLQWVYARNPENGFDPKLLAPRFHDPQNPEKRVFALWWFVFPNLTLNFYPWGLSANVYVPVPGKPNRTQFLWYHYALDEEKFQHRNDVWLSEQVDLEDIEAIRLVSRGAQSGFAPRGRFAPREEAGPHWFHRLIYEAIFEQRSTSSAGKARNKERL